MKPVSTNTFGLVVFGLIFGAVAAYPQFNKETSTVSSAPSEYQKCTDDPNVQFQAGIYKQKYPSLSTSQIMHTLCKDK